MSPIQELPKIEVPEREKPITAMADCPQFPYLPEGFENSMPSQMAELLVSSYLSAMEAYEVCEKKRQGLIDWINN